MTTSPKISAAGFAIEVIRAYRAFRPGVTLDDAARWFSTYFPSRTRQLLDVIGMAPSSEPELEALQRCAT